MFHPKILHAVAGSVKCIAQLFYCFVFPYRTTRKEQWEQKHQDYRFIAEVLAIQLHWSLAGIREYSSDYFPMGVKNDVQWVRRVVHTAQLLSSMDEKAFWSLDETSENWIGKDEHDENKQLSYHLFTLQKQRNKAHHSLKKKRKYFGVTFIVLLLVLTFCSSYEVYNAIHQPSLQGHGSTATAHNGYNPIDWIHLLHPWFTVIMITSLVVFALFGEAIEGYGIEQELTRSEELVDVYRRCLSEFTKKPDYVRKRVLLEEVGRFAIDAEANWLMLHRERPMQPVKGG